MKNFSLDEKAKESLRQGELVLNAQLQLRVALENRAVALGSCFAVFGVTLLIVAFTVLEDFSDNELVYFYCISGFITTMVNAVFCFLAAKPTHTKVSGNDPILWLDYIHFSYIELAYMESLNYSEYIKFNDKTFEKKI